MKVQGQWPVWTSRSRLSGHRPLVAESVGGAGLHIAVVERPPPQPDAQAAAAAAQISVCSEISEAHPEGYGDCYTFVAIDSDTKLMPCWLVGIRNRECKHDVMAALALRMACRIQLTTDDYNAYSDTVEAAFRGNVVLKKSYAGDSTAVEAKRRCSPLEFVAATKNVVTGAPSMCSLKHISTSIVERSNLSIRMGNRRFTRLTNAFSKKVENHMHALSLYAMVYNFVKIHKSIRTSPAMEAGVPTACG